jgi:hypothetical protein
VKKKIKSNTNSNAGRASPALIPGKERAKGIIYGAKRYYLTLKK